MYDAILVPTDGSDDARAAIEHGADIAARYGAAIHVLTVVPEGNLERVPAAEDSRLRWARERVDEAVDWLPDVDVPVETAVEIGDPHETILEYADAEDVDLVVMGTHGRTGLERYLLGSVTERVVRTSDVPVLTVRATDDGDSRHPYRNVLVPTDGSDGAAAAVDHGIDIADTYGATLHAVSVVDDRTTEFAVGAEAVIDQLEARANRAVESLEGAATTAGVDQVRTAVVTGTPHRAILDYSDDHDVDLIVIGTQGRSGLERLLLGSVTEKIVRTSDVPVLTVRAPAGD